MAGKAEAEEAACSGALESFHQTAFLASTQAGAPCADLEGPLCTTQACTWGREVTAGLALGGLHVCISFPFGGSRNYMLIFSTIPPCLVLPFCFWLCCLSSRGTEGTLWAPCPIPEPGNRRRRVAATSGNPRSLLVLSSNFSPARGQSAWEGHCGHAWGFVIKHSPPQ